MIKTMKEKYKENNLLLMINNKKQLSLGSNEKDEEDSEIKNDEDFDYV